MRGDIRKDNRGLAMNWIMGIFAMSVGLLFVILGLVFILPDLSRDSDAPFMFCMCEGLGGMATAVGAYQIYVEIKRSNKKKRLKEIGRPFKMPITRIVVDNTTRLNDMPGYKIVCTSPVFLDGAMQQYTSHIVYEDLYNRMSEGDIVTVYVDPEDVQNYYVDLDEVECAPPTTYNQQPMYDSSPAYGQQPMYEQQTPDYASQNETAIEQTPKPSTGGFKLRMDNDKPYSD